MWWNIGFSISLLGNLVLLWVVSNLLNQNRQLEDVVKAEGKLEDDIVKYYEVLLGIFQQAYLEMTRVDKRGSFSSDDEIGFSFKVIKGAIQDVVDKLQKFKTDREEK